MGCRDAKNRALYRTMDGMMRCNLDEWCGT
jgi:hypothetical protein